MAFQVGQKVKVKSTSASARITGTGVLTITRLGGGGETVCVKGDQAGARWVGISDLDPVHSEDAGTA